LFFAATLFTQQYTGFIFNPYRAEQLSIPTIFFLTYGVFFVWVVANMCVCTLNDGEGRFVDVWVHSAYALVPYVAFTVIGTLASRVLILEEASLYSIFSSVGFLWSAFLMFLGLKNAHQFTLGKTVASIILTLIGIIIIVFVILLAFVLMSKITEFISTIAAEIRNRQ
ncbi:MAG: YIP1 family protein, partial [Clostridia bacterium]|nr:YIP1 family protein [Clostridia bacterium]